ncbi:hypothetical protein L1887_37813 [Cichorium endivia]|nr:hypothetical protein L1887_37813 [Cichorium endivia]
MLLIVSSTFRLSLPSTVFFSDVGLRVDRRHWQRGSNVLENGSAVGMDNGTVVENVETQLDFVTESDEDTQSFDGNFSLLSSSNPAADPIQSQTIHCLESPIEFPILDAQLVSSITTSPEASRFYLGSLGGISNAAIGKGLSNQGMSIDAQCLVGLPCPTVNRI